MTSAAALEPAHPFVWWVELTTHRHVVAMEVKNTLSFVSVPYVLMTQCLINHWHNLYLSHQCVWMASDF